MKKLFLIFLIPIFVSCLSNDHIQFSQVDQNEKTVSIPPGSDGVLIKIKKYLIEAGWEIFVYSGPEKLEQISDTEFMKFQDFNSRYTLLVYAVPEYSKLPNSEYHYEISMIDNRQGKEVFSMYGFASQERIIYTFCELIEN